MPNGPASKSPVREILMSPIATSNPRGLNSAGSFVSSRRSFQRTHRQRRSTPCRAVRLDVQAVIPQLQGDATEQTPPDLPSFLFKERIVYLGMSLVPAVTELMLAELMYLQYDNPSKPVYMYINSAGVQKGAESLGYEFEALAIYDLMRYVKPPIYTLCVGNAFGEAAMLLAAGEKMQATDIDIRRSEVRKTKENLVRLLAKSTGQSPEKLERDISRPHYFNPYEAIEYGIIDKVLEPDNDEQRKLAKAGIQYR